MTSQLDDFFKIQKNNKALTSANIDYLETLIDDLKFKYAAIQYHIERIFETKKELEKIAENKITANLQKVNNESISDDNLFEKLKEGIKEKNHFSTPKISISLSEEVDSSKLFFEFESLLFKISSFIDYSFKILKIFFKDIKTSKSKIIRSISRNYPDSKIEKYIISEFESWITQLLNYRDHVMHLSSLNSNIVVKVENSPKWGTMTNDNGKVSISVSAEINSPEIQPIYLPLEPDYRHIILEKLESQEINHDDDFYTFEDYIHKLKIHFEKYSNEFFNLIK